MSYQTGEFKNLIQEAKHGNVSMLRLRHVLAEMFSLEQPVIPDAAVVFVAELVLAMRLAECREEQERN